MKQPAKPTTLETCSRRRKFTRWMTTFSQTVRASSQFTRTPHPRSHGVRDEFRVGYAALQAIADGVDELVESRIQLLAPKTLTQALAGQLHGRFQSNPVASISGLV